jgi:pantothenate kinase
VKPSLEELAERARTLTPPEGRAILGITGPPGAGKTTLVEALLAKLRVDPPSGPADTWVAHVPMDGFHLADVQLERLGLRDRKGAPETFDVGGYRATLARILDDTGERVYVPGFERGREQPIAAAIAVPPEVRLVLTEGNYLLLNDEPWLRVRQTLKEVWYVEVPDDVRVKRLISRHVEFGKSPDAASEWVRRSDEANAALVIATQASADLIVELWDGGEAGSAEDEARPS